MRTKIMRELQGPYENKKLTRKLESNIDKRLIYIYNVLKLENMKQKSSPNMGRLLSAFQKKSLMNFVNEKSFVNKFHHLTEFIYDENNEREELNEAELCYIKKMIFTLEKEHREIET